MKIGILAFPADQQIKLQRILSLSKTRNYELIEAPENGNVDLLVVFGEENLSQCNGFTLPASHILVASRNTPPNGHPHLKVPFISSRVLRIVDSTDPLSQPTVTAQPQPIASQNSTPAATQPAAEPVEAEPAPSSTGLFKRFFKDRSSETKPAQTAPAAESPSAAPTASTASPAPVAPAPITANTQVEPTPAAQPAPTQPASVAPASPQSGITQPREPQEDKDNLFKKYDAQIEEAQRQKAEQDAAASEMEYSVLVVDDSHPMQQVLAKELAQLEQTIHVDFADDGETALEKVATKHFDFIFLDIMMPGIDGFETCTKMRAMPALKKTPIIMLSSKTSPLDEVKGIMAGSSTYLTKPIDSEEFRKVIKRVSRWVSDFNSKRDQ